MLIKSVKIGNKVEIYHHRSQLDSKVYTSQVEDILSETRFLLHTPIMYGQLVKLPVGMKLGLLFFSDKAMLKFEASIVGYAKEDELDFTVIEIRSEGEKIQRRAFFRFNCLLPLKFHAWSETGEGEAHYEDGIIKDIGGGGMRFVTNLQIDEENVIRSVIMLNDELLMLTGKVLNKMYFPKSNFKYQYRIEFISVSKDDQETIVKYIFNEERKLRKKERL